MRARATIAWGNFASSTTKVAAQLPVAEESPATQLSTSGIPPLGCEASKFALRESFFKAYPTGPSWRVQDPLLRTSSETGEVLR